MEDLSHHKRISAFASAAQITVSEEIDEVVDPDNVAEEDFSIFENVDGLSDDMRFLASQSWIDRE